MVQLTIVNEITGDIYSFEVDPKSDTVENLKALMEIETKIPILQQEMFYQNFPMRDEDVLEKYGISESELVVFKRRSVQSTPPTARTNPTQNPFQLLSNALNANRPQQAPPSSSNTTSNTRSTSSVPPPSTSNLQTNYSSGGGGGGGVVTEDLLNEILGGISRSNPRLTRQQELEKRLRQNPFDVEAQKLLEEEIKMRNIEENFHNAMEHTPETFFQVNMLYVDCKVNGHALKAFVDSGAQMTIMSKSCAERCGLMRLLDTRYRGVAKGVGSCEILGRIHLTLMQLGGSTFPVTITVLNQGGMQFLLGLDMLKRHQMMIDLKDNVLRVGDEKISFLPPHECPNEIADIESPKPTSHDINKPHPFDMRQSSTEKETVIKQLMEMIGVDRETAVKALELAKGNAELAASLLFEQKEHHN
ncbi:hypothetical protein FDP41_008917 [Naegleria fowleri]|uniref:Ubiquitin-like domain-containing protein n=1 Tax=Naegleria fowleri TaxID=5763 RepID=A0A6A5BFC7_NAEFO|nr:uncharacterized protein FDP41_008917 [Naegleria fowleri]KAF0972668.1 hypothetical protein FDP41_008917 [Naegleria fowleri]CAG4718385.1 unnamed protein product [Naegleria fowleri]